MRMRNLGLSLLSVLFAMPAMPAMPAMAAAPAIRTTGPFIDEYTRLFGSRRSHAGYRARGKPARRRSRPNRLHISRRVRRAHRRSKAA